MQNKNENISGPLNVPELDTALSFIIKIIQAKYFPKEINTLKNKLVIADKQILSLKPFLDTDNIIRVGGRLSYASISYSHKYPILLPSKCAVVKLLLKLEHIRLGHSGPQNVLSNIRLRYWPLNSLR